MQWSANAVKILEDSDNNTSFENNSFMLYEGFKCSKVQKVKSSKTQHLP